MTLHEIGFTKNKMSYILISSKHWASLQPQTDYCRSCKCRPPESESCPMCDNLRRVNEGVILLEDSSRIFLTCPGPAAKKSGSRLCHSKRWLYGVSSHSKRLCLFQKGFTHRNRHLPPVSSKALLGISGDTQGKTNEHIEYCNE